MAYEYLTQYNSPNFGYPRGTKGQNSVDEIIIHHWGADGQSFMGVVNWLCRQGGDSSAHFVVEHSRVACVIDHGDSAWHSGNYYVNNHSIGIECRPEMSEGDLETLCELVASLYIIYGILPIRGHKDVVPTACPGKYYDKLGYIKQKAIEIMNGASSKEVPSTPVAKGRKTASELAQEVLAGMWGNGEERKNNLSKAGYNFDEIQSKVNELCGVSSTPYTPSKTVTQLAQEVIRGDWGIGSDRASRLTNAGYNYGEVQAEVNRLLGLTSGITYTSNSTDLTEIARAVIRGDYGNGEERYARLKSYGYDPDAVQRRVNELLR